MSTKGKKTNVRLNAKSVPALPFLDKLLGRSTLGKTIAAIRQSDEISQSDFAKKLRVSQSYLCDLEKNRKVISPKKAAEFARILDHSEVLFVTLAIDDMLSRQGLHYRIELHEAA